MNIITNADVKKFLTLVKAGLKEGKEKELKVYDHANVYDGTRVTKNHYVALEFRFYLDGNKIEELFIEDDADLTNQIDDLLK